MKLFKRTARNKATGELETVSENYWFRFEFRGKVYTASTRLSNYKEAIKVATAARNNVVLKDAGLAPADPKLCPTVQDFSKTFLNYTQPRVAPRTWRYYSDYWTHLLNHAPMATCRLADVDASVIEGFVQARLASKDGGKGGKGAPNVITVNHSLRTLRRALHVAEELKLIAKAPKVRLLRGERNRDFVLTETLLQAFVALCKPPDVNRDWQAKRDRLDPLMADLLTVLVDTGLRIGEAVALEWPQVTLEGRGHIHILKGKTSNARRFIPLPARAKDILLRLKEARPAKTEAVFTHNGRPITVTWASHQFTWARRYLGLPPTCVLHSSRHTYCTRLGEAGADAFTIQKLAGHATIQQSSRYVHPSEARLESTVALLDASS